MEFPINTAVKKVVHMAGKPIELAIVRRCCVCGKRHVHGWGTGHRLGHCEAPYTSTPGYMLVCEG